MIYLRSLKKTDADKMLEWMHDEDTKKCFKFPMMEQTKDDVLHFIEKNYMDFHDDNWRLKEVLQERVQLHFAIADEKNDEYYGTISLKNIDWQSKNAEFAISTRKCSRGKGIAKEAAIKLLRIAFDVLNLRRVYLNVLPDNYKAIKLYEKIGFQKEGISRKHIIIDGIYRDVIWYGLLLEDFEYEGQ